MLHDQGRTLTPPSVLEKLVAGHRRRQSDRGQAGHRKPNEVRGPAMNYLGLSLASKGDNAKRRDVSRKGVEGRPGRRRRADRLLSLARQPPRVPCQDRRADREEAAVLRQEIAETAGREQTAEEADLRRLQPVRLADRQHGGRFRRGALKYSRKSVELLPTEGGFYDTLARVYLPRASSTTPSSSRRRPRSSSPTPA